MTPDWRDAGGDEFVELTATRARTIADRGGGGGPLLLGTFTTIHTVRDQTIDLQFGASRDGLSWWRPGDRRSCVPMQPAGDWGSGQQWPWAVEPFRRRLVYLIRTFPYKIYYKRRLNDSTARG